jgi:hypothetical protein
MRRSSPVRVLAAEPQDQRAQRRLERRPVGTPMWIRPAASDQLAVPAQQPLGPDREARPGDSRQRAAERCQQRPISPRRPRLPSLPREHREFHGAAPGSRAPSSGEAAPATRRARARSARRDERTTGASSPRRPDNKRPEPSLSGRGRTAGRVYEPYGHSWSAAVASTVSSNGAESRCGPTSSYATTARRSASPPR